MSRVLVVTNDFPTRRGGIETFVFALCERMDPAELVVYTSSMPGDAEFDAKLPFPVFRDPSSMLLPTPAVGRRVEEVMRRFDCDRVVFGASAPLGLLGPRLRRAGATRIVALTHGHEVWWARVPVTRRLLRRIGDGVDVMTYVSEWCRDRIAPALSARAAASMQRLSPGVDPALFHPDCGGVEMRQRLGISPEQPVIVCTARLVRRKGQDRLIRVLPQVREAFPDVVLLVVGEGPDRGRLEKLARERGVEDSVVFTGSAPWGHMSEYTDAGDVFAMPCRTRLWGLEAEAWGIVFLEAQACGLPVVVGDSGGSPETVISPASGTVVSSEAELREALVAVLSGPRPRARTVETRWTWDGCSRELTELLAAGSAAAAVGVSD